MPVKNILIADDDQEIRSLLTESIEDEGCLVFSAANGKEAVEIAKNKPIDLAILDVRMPEMDGITALKLIKKIDRNIEILIITGYGDLQNLRKLIVKEGAFDYLLKPFTLNDIKHSIKRALQRRELNLKKNFVSADLEHRIREMESDFKQKTIQLRESQLKYKNIIQDSVDMIIIIQAEKIRFMNPMTSELTGYTEEDLLNTSFIDCEFCASKQEDQRHPLSEIEDSFSQYSLIKVPLFPNEIRGVEKLKGLADYLMGISKPYEFPKAVVSVEETQACLTLDPNLEFILFGGKGGVGKTSIASAAALHLARCNPDKNILVFCTDPAHSLSDSFKLTIGNKITPVQGSEVPPSPKGYGEASRGRRSEVSGQWSELARRQSGGVSGNGQRTTDN